MFFCTLDHQSARTPLGRAAEVVSVARLLATSFAMGGTTGTVGTLAV